MTARQEGPCVAPRLKAAETRSPPPAPCTRPGGSDISAIDQALRTARLRIAPRATPAELDDLVREGGLIIDIRPVELRDRDGAIGNAVVVDRNVLEWRLDPTCPYRLPGFDDPSRRVVIVCDEGYASSLAAAGLADLGLINVTDLLGGFQAWQRYRGPGGRAARIDGRVGRVN